MHLVFFFEKFEVKKCHRFYDIFLILTNNFKVKGVRFTLNVKLNVKSVFKIDTNREDFIELFNYKLLKIIIYLETQGGEN